MKLLYIPLQPGNSNTDDLFNAFVQSGHNVHFYKSADEAIAFQPEIVYIHSGALHLDLVTAIKNNTKAIWTQWTGDCDENKLLEPVLRYKDICSHTFLACGDGMKKVYEDALGHPVHWLPHAVAKWQFRQVKADAQGIVFIGNNYTHFSGGNERLELVRELQKRKDFTVYGNGWENAHPIAWDKVPDAYNHAFIGISNNLINNVPLYFSNRPLNIMAAGSMCLMRYVPGIEEYFTDGFDCLMYSDIDYAIKQLDIHRDYRNEIALNGQNTVREHFTYDNIVKMFEKAIG